MTIAPIPETVEFAHAPGDRKRILVCVPRYLPGYKSGGPIRAIANMVANLSANFDFFVVTRDRDATDTETYPGITPNRWHRVDSAHVLYCSEITPAILRRAFNEAGPDLISLNSFQDTFTRIMVRLRRAGAFGKTPMLLAPRGEFSPGATKIKPVKKFFYRHATKLLGFHEQLHWQASAEREKEDILRMTPARRLNPEAVHVACEMSDAVASALPHPTKEPGSVKLAFIARISEMKNLHFLLESLQQVRGRIELNLYGPIAEKDAAYWGKCKEHVAKLPSEIIAAYHGSLDHSAVPQTLHDHHFFVLPTKGENFCHAVVESLVNGTPVVLSDQTPWMGLDEAVAGFNLPVSDTRPWTAAIQQCVDMDQLTYERYLDGARKYSRRFSVEEAVRQHLTMFNGILNATAAQR